MNDPLQTGTWEIQVTAKGTSRVRVQGKEGDIPGKGRGDCRAQRAISVTFISGRSLTAFALPQPRPPWTSSSTLGSPGRMDPTLASTP